ncbi:MAG TPA: N-acetylmuramoyl-L-alanine amidase [Stellaceae bacterium]|nr:N-acetylmuramoyl-L-alanine amidase [Stellaceae bacterium]
MKPPKADIPIIRDTLFRDHPWLAPLWHERPSPNHGPRTGGHAIDILLLHYTGMKNRESALDRLCDPAAEVSCHYLIDEDGTIWNLVDENRRAWHAGEAFWAGSRDINSRSIGIELVNPGHEYGYRSFPAAQMNILAELAKDIMERHQIPRQRVLGHSDVAPQRKMDPGELFDWAWLAARGIGVFPSFAASAPEIEPGLALAEIGYEIGHNGPDTGTIIAFQRHFLADRLSGTLDTETCRRIAQVHAAMMGRVEEPEPLSDGEPPEEDPFPGR